MTRDVLAVTPSYPINGVGPYPYNNPYRQASLFAYVIIDEWLIPLVPSEYTADPLSSDSIGGITLSTSAATTYDGGTLHIFRQTDVEQGFAGQSPREDGLAAQLDWMTEAIQDMSHEVRRSLRSTSSLLPGVLLPGFTVMIDDNGKLVAGPRAAEINLAQEFAIRAEAAADRVDLGALDRGVELAQNARDKSQEWAENPEDVEVEPGEFSSLHHATKARAYAVQTAEDRLATGTDVSTTTVLTAQAEAARDNATVNADVYVDIATGRSAVADTEQFSVVSADGLALSRYRRDSASTQTLMAVTPSSEYVNAVNNKDQASLTVGHYDERFALFDVSTQVVTNIQDAAGVSYTATKVTGGLQINLSTARLCTFSTASSVGDERTKIKYRAECSFSGNLITGIGMGDGTDRFELKVQNNGWLVLGNTRGGSGIITQNLGAMTTGDVVDIQLIVHPNAETAHCKVSVGGRVPYVVELTNLPMGDIVLVQDETGTSVTHSLDLSTVAPFSVADAKTPNLNDEQKGDIFSLKAFMAGYERVYPSGFSGRFPDYFRVYKHPATGDFLTNYSPNLLFVDEDPVPARIYVDIATGSDTAAGTETAPIKSIHKAISALGTGAKAKVYVKGGLYPFQNCWRSAVAGDGSTVEVVSWDGLPVISSMHDDGLTWTLDTDNTYSATFADTVNNVFDASILTADGDYSILPLAADLATCRATPGTYFITGSTIYVHTSDNRAPDGDVRVYKFATFFDYNGQARGLGATLHLENIQFEGGKNAFRGTLSDNTAQATVTGKDCSFKYSSNGSAPVLNGAYLGIWEECVASWNQSDGFHYNPIFGSPPADGIELNCNSHWNGVGAGGVGNNSSSHGGSTIRVKTKDGWGEYHNAEGRGIHDISEVTNCLSWCLGITSRDSRNGYPNFAIGLNGEAGVSKMWLDGCISSGTATDIQANASAEAYTADFTGGGVNTGTVAPYTP